MLLDMLELLASAIHSFKDAKVLPLPLKIFSLLIGSLLLLIFIAFVVDVILSLLN